MARHKHAADTGLTVFTVNGNAFAAGLVWLPLKSARNYKAEAKARGKADGRPLAVIRHGRSVTQAGFARRDRRSVKGTYSLAATLAGVLGDDFIGVFEIEPDRYALVAVHKGAVLPGRDMVGDYASVETLLRETYNLVSTDGDSGDVGGIGKVIVPAKFEFASERATLAELLQPGVLRSEYRLRPLSLTGGELAIAGAVLLAVGASVYGYQWWQARLLREQAASDARIAAQREASSAPAPEVVKPWVSLPSAGRVLDACRDYFDAVPVAIAGWQFSDGHCGPSGASRTYRRDGGNVVAFGQALAPGATPAYGDAFNTAGLSDPIALPADASDVLPARATREREVTAYFQRIDSFATASIALKPPPPPSDGEPAPVPPWSTYTITVTSALPPDLLFADLDLDGLRVLDIAVALDANAALNWTITGEFHAQ